MITVRYAELADVPAITDIYNEYVLYSTATFDVEPKSIEDRTEWFYAHPRDSHYKLLCAVDDQQQVTGFTATNPFRPKEAYHTSVETTVYVAPNQRNTGIGKLLYAALFEAVAEEDLHRAYACIALPNPSSMSLHHSFGFSPAGLFHEAGRKFGRYISIQWMEKSL